MCTCTCIYVYIYAHTYIFIYAYIYICIRTDIYDILETCNWYSEKHLIPQVSNSMGVQWQQNLQRLRHSRVFLQMLQSRSKWSNGVIYLKGVDVFEYRMIYLNMGVRVYVGLCM